MNDDRLVLVIHEHLAHRLNHQKSVGQNVHNPAGEAGVQGGIGGRLRLPIQSPGGIRREDVLQTVGGAGRAHNALIPELAEKVRADFTAPSSAAVVDSTT